MPMRRTAHYQTERAGDGSDSVKHYEEDRGLGIAVEDERIKRHRDGGS